MQTWGQVAQVNTFECKGFLLSYPYRAEFIIYSNGCLEQLNGPLLTLFSSSVANLILSGEVQSLWSEYSRHLETIRHLESDLNVYKCAFTNVSTELATARMQKIEADKQKEDLETRLKVG